MNITSVAPNEVLERVRTLRDSLLDFDSLVDDEHRALLEHLDAFNAAVAKRDEAARGLAAAIAEAAR